MVDSRHGPGRGPGGWHVIAGPRVVTELLGHSQMRAITDTYSHMVPSPRNEPRTPWARRSEARRPGPASPTVPNPAMDDAGPPL